MFGDKDQILYIWISQIFSKRLIYWNVQNQILIKLIYISSILVIIYPRTFQTCFTFWVYWKKFLIIVKKKAIHWLQSTYSVHWLLTCLVRRHLFWKIVEMSTSFSHSPKQVFAMSHSFEILNKTRKLLSDLSKA